MNITEIKNKLGVTTLGLNTSKDSAGNPTDWMRSWDNDTRTAVSIHKDLVQELQNNPGITSLGLQSEEREAAQGTYTAMRIVKFTEAETTL
jgi:hypothetical protein